MSVHTSPSSSPHAYSHASAAARGGSSSSASATTIQRDINRLFSSQAPSHSATASRHSPTPYNSKPKENIHSLPTNTLQDRLQSQRQLLASLDAGLLALPDNGQRIRNTIAAIESILASRASPPPPPAAGGSVDEDALVKHMQAVTISSATPAPQKPSASSSSKFHRHRMHVLSDDAATQVLTHARELERKRNMQAALARLREGTAKFHANPPSWARPALAMSTPASMKPAAQRAAAPSTVTQVSASSFPQPPIHAATDVESDSDWDTDSDDEQEDFLDGLDLGYDAFSDGDDDGDPALGSRMSASGMDVDSDEDEDGDGDSGYQYRQ